MSTVYVKRYKVLPIQFTQLAGDREAMQAASEANATGKRAGEVKAAKLMEVYAHHWDSLSSLNIDPSAIAGEAGEGIRTWTTDYGLPMLRALYDTAAGRELKDEHKDYKQYYSVLVRGVLYCVSPFAEDSERVLSFNEYRAAIKAKAGASEEKFQTILRGLRTFMGSNSQGIVHGPDYESCVTASAGLSDAERTVFAQVAAAMLTDDDLKRARKDLQKDAVRQANAEHAQRREQANVEQQA